MQGALLVPSGVFHICCVMELPRRFCARVHLSHPCHRYLNSKFVWLIYLFNYLFEFYRSFILCKSISHLFFMTLAKSH